MYISVGGVSIPSEKNATVKKQAAKGSSAKCPTIATPAGYGETRDSKENSATRGIQTGSESEPSQANGRVGQFDPNYEIRGVEEDAADEGTGRYAENFGADGAGESGKFQDGFGECGSTLEVVLTDDEVRVELVPANKHLGENTSEKDGIVTEYYFDEPITCVEMKLVFWDNTNDSKDMMNYVIVHWDWTKLLNEINLVHWKKPKRGRYKITVGGHWLKMVRRWILELAKNSKKNQKRWKEIFAVTVTATPPFDISYFRI